MPAYRGFQQPATQENRLFSLAWQTLYPHTPEEPAADQGSCCLPERMLDVMDAYSEQRGRLAIVRTADVVQKFTSMSLVWSTELLSVKGLGRRSQQVGGQRLRIKSQQTTIVSQTTKALGKMDCLF